MGQSSLGRVLDASALDASAGPRARLCVDVPAAWLEEGADIVVTTPGRLACAHCDGGGCDACGRSGALRAPAEAERRVVRASFGPAPDAGLAAITLRIAFPFGPEHGVDQLLLEVRAGDAASACVARALPASRQNAGMGAAPRIGRPVVWIALAVAVAVLFAILGR